MPYDLENKNCPFCGHKEVSLEDTEDELVFVQCRKCYATGSFINFIDIKDYDFEEPANCQTKEIKQLIIDETWNKRYAL